MKVACLVTKHNQAMVSQYAEIDEPTYHEPVFDGVAAVGGV